MNIINSSDSLIQNGKVCAIFGYQKAAMKMSNASAAGLVPLKHKSHSNSKMRYHNVALVEAIHWAVEQINSNPEILPNFTVGYEIRDTMSDPAYSSVQVFKIFIM